MFLFRCFVSSPFPFSISLQFSHVMYSLLFALRFSSVSCASLVLQRRSVRAVSLSIDAVSMFVFCSFSISNSFFPVSIAMRLTWSFACLASSAFSRGRLGRVSRDSFISLFFLISL